MLCNFKAAMSEAGHTCGVDAIEKSVRLGTVQVGMWGADL